jgi:hypothetical protein
MHFETRGVRLLDTTNQDFLCVRWYPCFHMFGSANLECMIEIIFLNILDIQIIKTLLWLTDGKVQKRLLSCNSICFITLLQIVCSISPINGSLFSTGLISLKIFRRDLLSKITSTYWCTLLLLPCIKRYLQVFFFLSQKHCWYSMYTELCLAEDWRPFSVHWNTFYSDSFLECYIHDVIFIS